MCYHIGVKYEQKPRFFAFAILRKGYFQMNFTVFNKNGDVEGFCLIKELEKRVTAKGKPYLDMVLADSTGEIVAKLWDYNEDAHSKYSAGQAVKVRGIINEYNGVEQIKVDMIRPLAANDEVRMEDLVPSSEHSGDEMLREIFTVVEGFEDSELKNLVLAVINANMEKLLYWPAAFRLHHAMRGGLLYHTLSILRLAQGVCKVYPFVDKDLLYTGVILHDLAKTGEFDVTEAGVATGYTTDGTLVGHLVRGAMEIERIGKELGTPKETLMLVEHMVISHHGEPEFGAVVRPMFLEAELLSQLDMMDARVYAIAQAVDEIKTGDFTNRMWSLDNRKLYNHGRNSAEPKANLI